MAITRRNFLASTSSVIAICAMMKAEGSIHGSATAATNSPVILNIGGATNTVLQTDAFLNVAKTWNPASAQAGWPALLSGTNGYPSGNFTCNATGSVLFDPAYYGRYTLSWTDSGGSGGIGGISGNPVILYNSAITSATIFNISPATSGVTTGNFGVFSGGAGVNVEFAFGILIGAVSTSSGADHGGTGLVKFTSTSTGYVGNFADGATFKFNNTNLPAGPNSDGSWTINVIDANNLSLVGSSALAGTITLNTSGTIGTNTEGIYSTSVTNASLFNNWTGSNSSNLIWCKKGDLIDIQAGKLAAPTMVNAIKGSNAAYIRFMDMIPVQAIQTAPFAQRVTPSSFVWGNFYTPFACWAGVMTNSSDTFTCPINPANSPQGAGSAYVDGEFIHVQVGPSAQNTTQSPKLGITGRAAAAPVYGPVCDLLHMTLSGSVPPTGTNLAITFNGGGLSNFVYHYLTSTTVNGPGGVTDTSFANIAINIRSDIQGNVRGNATAFLAANMYCENPDLNNFPGALASFYYNMNMNAAGTPVLGAGVTITGNDPSSSMTFTFGLVPVALFANGLICSFTYSALLQAWIGTPGTNLGGAATIGGARGGPPLEYCAELCSRTNAGMWYNIGVADTAASIFSTVQLLGQATFNGQPAIKTLALEWGNETWNGQLSLHNPTKIIAAGLGISETTQAGDYSSHGLRTLQMAQQATTAWAAAGRARSDLKIVNAYQFVNLNSAGTSDTSVFKFNGSALNASGTGTNATLKAFGGLGATVITTDFSTAPNRPIDWCDWMSPATYWQGAQYGANSNGFENATLSNLNDSLLAAYNFAYGNSTQQTAALDFLYNISAVTGDFYSGTLRDGTQLHPETTIANFAVGSGSGYAGYAGVGTVAASYDSSRSSTGRGGGAQLKLGVACYEGGWQMGPVFGSQLIGPLNSLGYTAGYSSGLPGAAAGPTGAGDTSTTASQNLYNLLIAWKNDARASTLVTKQFTQFRNAVNVVSARDAYPAWYGLQGGNIFAIFPGLVTQQIPYQAYNAIAAFR